MTENNKVQDGPDRSLRLRFPVRGGFKALLAVLALAVVLVAVGGVVLRNKNSSFDDDESARAAASLVANTSVAELFSYDYRTISQVVAKRSDLVTGKFADDYKELVTTQVAPAAAKQKLTTRTEIATSAVLSAKSGEVTMLMFLNQTSARAKSNLPVLTGSRVEVTMKFAEGKWKVAGVKPV
ncbi:MAG: hypothetical protein JWR83_2629 [Aeromicrobium sp.]|nr:hypothetical protein [Aeromicrobium sp.]